MDVETGIKHQLRIVTDGRYVPDEYWALGCCNGLLIADAGTRPRGTDPNVPNGSSQEVCSSKEQNFPASNPTKTIIIPPSWELE